MKKQDECPFVFPTLIEQKEEPKNIIHVYVNITNDNKIIILMSIIILLLCLIIIIKKN